MVMYFFIGQFLNNNLKYLNINADRGSLTIFIQIKIILFIFFVGNRKIILFLEFNQMGRTQVLTV